MEIIRRIYPDLGLTIGAFCHATRVGDLLFISGMTARGTDAEHGDMEAQTDAVLGKIDHVLKSEGASFEDVARVTVYVTDLADFEKIHHVRKRYFGDNLPASTLVQVASLIGSHLKIEIEAIAALPDRR
ncbi:MAG: RidA family protein [Chloroflexi bacterium]|nr:RidA family protein [Chloroflexota bacterium]